MRSTSGKVRIIGGKWRSRRLDVPTEGVRPTPDAVKETVFNWLSPFLVGATCLDLFSGTGALGFEAASRGAAHVDMVDGSSNVIKNLKAHVQRLNANEISIYQLKLPEDLKKLKPKKYNLIFIDAPFRKNLLLPCCLELEKQALLAEEALIYLEMERELMPLKLPPHWILWREKKSGQVAYCVYHLPSKQLLS